MFTVQAVVKIGKLFSRYHAIKLVMWDLEAVRIVSKTVNRGMLTMVVKVKKYEPEKWNNFGFKTWLVPTKKSKRVEAITVTKVSIPKDAIVVAPGTSTEAKYWNKLANGLNPVTTKSGKVKFTRRLWHCRFYFETLTGLQLKKLVDIFGKTEDEVLAKVTDPKSKIKVLGASSFQMIEPSGLKREQIYFRHYRK